MLQDICHGLFIYFYVLGIVNSHIINYILVSILSELSNKISCGHDRQITYMIHKTTSADPKDQKKYFSECDYQSLQPQPETPEVSSGVVLRLKKGLNQSYFFWC